MVIKRKNLYKFTYCFIFFMFIGIVLLPTVHAAGSISDFPSYMLDTINSGVIKTIQENLTAGSDDKPNKFYALMVGTGEERRLGLSKAIKVIFNATVSVAMLKVLIFTMTKLFQDLDKGKDLKESIYKSFLALFLTGVIVLNIIPVLGMVVKIGEWLISEILTINNTSPIDKATLKQITGKDSGGIIWWIQSFAILIIPYILTLLMCVVAKFISFSILIELGVRKAFAPFSVVDIYSEGMRSPGMRYLKRYLATFLKIVIALMVCYIGIELMEATIEGNLADAEGLGDILTYIFDVIAINFTVLGVIAKTGEYANDIVGV